VVVQLKNDLNKSEPRRGDRPAIYWITLLPESGCIIYIDEKFQLSLNLTEIQISLSAILHNPEGVVVQLKNELNQNGTPRGDSIWRALNAKIPELRFKDERALTNH
jgi:hypothetical protein